MQTASLGHGDPTTAPDRDVATLADAPASWPFIAGVSLVLVAYAVASVFAHPMADDFDYAASARSGLWSMWWQAYRAWNGRYASNVFVLATPLSIGWLGTYRLAAVLVLAATAAAAWAFVRHVAPALNHRDAATCSLVLCAVYLVQAPSIGEGIYWYTGAATYQLAIVLGLLHAAAVIRAEQASDTVGRIVCLTAAGGSLVAAIGCNEIIMLVMVAAYTVALAGVAYQPGRQRAMYAALLAVAIASAALVAGSPGNAVRAALYPARHQLRHSVVMTVLQTLRFAGDWATSGPLLLSTILFVPLAGRLQPPATRDRRTCWRLSIAGLAGAVPVGVFPVYWSTGVLGQHRTLNTAYFIFLVSWFLAVAALPATAPVRFAGIQAVARRLRTPAALLLLVALAATRNSYGLGFDLVTGRLTSMNRQLRERYAALDACRTRAQRTCDIPGLDTPPASLLVVDISPDAANWVNAAYAHFFRVGEVRRTPDRRLDIEARH